MKQKKIKCKSPKLLLGRELCNPFTFIAEFEALRREVWKHAPPDAGDYAKELPIDYVTSILALRIKSQDSGYREVVARLMVRSMIRRGCLLVNRKQLSLPVQGQRS